MADEPKEVKKNVKIGIILAVVLIGVAAGGMGWYHILRTTVSTDNAKVSCDLVNISPNVSGKLQCLYVVEG